MKDAHPLVAWWEGAVVLQRAGQPLLELGQGLVALTMVDLPVTALDQCPEVQSWAG